MLIDEKKWRVVENHYIAESQLEAIAEQGRTIMKAKESLGIEQDNLRLIVSAMLPSIRPKQSWVQELLVPYGQRN